MRKLVLFAIMVAGYIAVSAQGVSTAGKNIAYQDHNVRISVITDGAVRLEYTPDGNFMDDNSFIAINRNYPEAKYTVKDKGKKVTVATVHFILSYLKGTGKFTADNLSITSPKGKNVVAFSWKPGIKDAQNLKGTYRTLDGYNGNLYNGKTPMPIEDGLLSKSGWTLIDDSEGYIFDHSDWPWVAHRANEGKTQDWYFMAYGHDYKKALKDFTAFSGKVPLPPRFAFGYWWSRYWAYSDNEMRSLVGNFHQYNIPLDVMVIDMDWHYTEEGKGGWTGYTWNRRLFPSPQGFLQWLRNEGLHTTLNLHPADGIKHYEEFYPQMAKWMGVDTTQHKDIAWNAGDKKFMTGWLNTQLRPMEKWGVSFWWLDWQQWGNDKGFPHLSNTWWINYCVFTDMQRNGETRPMLYHRWGGLGNHRYQIGFSGDSYISWNSLDFQPYFNSTASNVLYGYWSHDIGGHMQANSIDPEMYVRWMQFGAYSPILRSHSTKNSGLNKEPWVFAEKYTTILRDIINGRYALAPYIYTMARKTYDDAISLCRPMYYDYPDSQEAYDNKNEYMFGDQMLVYPITAPMTDGISSKTVWLPAGNDWFEISSGTLLRGGQTVQRKFQIDEMPVYVKAGSIIPEYGKVKNLQGNDEPVIVTVYPGGDGKFTLYEDNGDDKDYATQYATTQLTSRRIANMLTIGIAAREGSYRDMPANRQFKVKVVSSAVPSSVKVNGTEVNFEYDGNSLSLLVDIPETSCSAAKEVVISYPQDAPDVAEDGLVGKFRHIQQNAIKLKRQNPGIVFTEELGTMESTGMAITYYPSKFSEYIALFRKNYAHLSDVLKAQKLDDNTINDFLRTAY